MKLQIISDIHLEFDKFEIVTNAQVLVVAGDVCEFKNLKLFFDFFKDVSEKFEHVIYVPGNHEYYHGDFFNINNGIKQELKIFNNIHVLDDSSVKIDDVTFIGSTLWTDFNAGDSLALNAARFNMADFFVIMNNGVRFTVEDSMKLNESSRKFILSELKNTRGKVVIVTHHLPDLICVNDKWKKQQTMLLNYSFANTKLLDKVIDFEPNLWIHGHTHDIVDVDVFNTRIVCNPKGYKEENKDFKNLIIEI